MFERLKHQKVLSVTLLVFTLSIGVLIGTLIDGKVSAANKQSTVAPDATPLQTPPLSQIGNDFTSLAKKLEPSVVYIKVRPHGERQDYQVHGTGTGSGTDLAVIKVDKGNLTPVAISSSDSVQVGDWAVALGSPFGFEATGTAGIVSATGRDVSGS